LAPVSDLNVKGYVLVASQRNDITHPVVVIVGVYDLYGLKAFHLEESFSETLFEAVG
jgi:hypothetical protein